MKAEIIPANPRAAQPLRVGLSFYIGEQLLPWHRELPKELKAKFDPMHLSQRRPWTYSVSLAEEKLSGVMADASLAKGFLAEYLEHPDVTLDLMQEIRRIVFRPRTKREAIMFALNCLCNASQSDDEVAAIVDSTWDFRRVKGESVTRQDVKKARQELARQVVEVEIEDDNGEEETFRCSPLEPAGKRKGKKAR